MTRRTQMGREREKKEKYKVKEEEKKKVIKNNAT